MWVIIICRSQKHDESRDHRETQALIGIHFLSYFCKDWEGIRVSVFSQTGEAL